ncbi:hypothetical protein ACIG3E_33265 [Streptomyces sp. NPDC053474]|uniref:hypothetical protein n=1 Tax=Streptomyces sp. NPDC053474 TaxID=3365704 RepID=UPI0037D058FD
MLENATTPAQPDAEQLRVWLAEQDPNRQWAAEAMPDGGRVWIDGLPDVSSPRALWMALTRAADLLEGAASPWPLEVELDGAALIVRTVTQEETGQRRASRHAERGAQPARSGGTAARLQQEARKRQRAYQGLLADRRREVEQWRQRHATNRYVQRVDLAELPDLAYSHGPGRYRGWSEPRTFRPPGRVPLTRGAMPQRGTGLWTSPVRQTNAATGAVLSTVWSSHWEQAGRDPERFSQHVRIVPEPYARIVRVDDLEDLRALVRAYPNPVGLDEDQHRFPDWPRLAQDWDAVYLTANGAAETARTPDSDGPHLEGWKCEAVLWLQRAYTVAEGL